MTREETLNKAIETVCGHREQDYGSPENNFDAIARYWDTYLSFKPLTFPITAEDVANMMCLFKLGRVTTGTVKEDSYVDLAGYAACGAEIVALKKEQEKIDEYWKTHGLGDGDPELAHEDGEEEECGEDSCPIF